ncbi:MAG: response regulator [Bacteroidia bacterium]
METILLIEDHKDILENLKEFFELKGYNVLTADNGKEGVDLAIKCKPDLIICDFIMCPMNGQEVLELILTNDRTNKIPFIFCTSMSEKSDRIKAINFGADEYIVKPFDLDSILELAKEQINEDNKRKALILPLLNYLSIIKREEPDNGPGKNYATQRSGVIKYKIHI